MSSRRKIPSWLTGVRAQNFLSELLFSKLSKIGTYYAAQTGLDLKVHEIAARDYLYTLIAALEEVCSTFCFREDVASKQPRR